MEEKFIQIDLGKTTGKEKFEVVDEVLKKIQGPKFKCQRIAHIVTIKLMEVDEDVSRTDKGYYEKDSKNRRTIKEGN